MAIRNWLRGSQRRPASKVLRRERLSVELLEDRSVPAAFLVNTTDDTTGVVGSFSLRDAIEAANLNPGDDAISFDSALTTGGPATISLNSTLHLDDATGKTTISGPGAGLLTVSGNGGFYNFEVNNGGASLSGLAVTNGVMGIFNLSTDLLTLTDCTFSNNVRGATFFGPGDVSGCTFTANAIGIDSHSSTNITDTAFSGNQLGMYTEGSAAFTDSTFTGNYLYGGLLSGGASTVTIDGCTFTGNSASQGGAIYVQSGWYTSSTMTITNTTITGNSASGNGGAIFHARLGVNTTSTLTIIDSTISGNSGSSGGAIANFDALTLTRSTLANNTSSDDSGAIANFSGGNLSIENSTLFGNSTANDGGAIRNSGMLTVTSSTFAGNHASWAGGAIRNDGTMTITNSIVAGNTMHPGLSYHYDVSNYGTLTASGPNMVPFLDAQGTQVGAAFMTADPLLDGLASNGGATETMALLAGSPALGAGDPTQAGTVAQNGVVRSAGSVDIGAYQSAAVASHTTATGGTFTYDGTMHAGSGSVDVVGGGVTLTYEGISGTVYSSAIAPTNAGTYAVTASYAGDAGHTASSDSAIITINKASFTYTIGNATHVYGSTVDLAAALGTTINTGVNGENLAIAYSSTGNTVTSNVANYNITAIVSNGTGVASNYAVTLTPGVLSVTRATLTGNATAQDALNMAKQGKLNITISGVAGLVNGDTLSTFLSTAEFYITVGTHKYIFIPTTVTTEGTSITISYTLKNSALVSELAAELASHTSGSTAITAGFFMESANYSFTDGYLTRMFSTGN